MSGEEGKGRNSRPQSTGGVNRKADPRGGSSRGGVDASDHSGWSSENNPWGGSSSSGVHWGGGSGKGNNSGQGGNLSSGVSLTLFPEAQASAAFGAPVNISLIDGMWGFSVFRASPVQEAVAAALAKLEQGLVSALPYVGRLVGVVFGLLIPSSIAPDDKSMMSQIVTTLPAVRVTDTPVSTLPTQPGTITVHTRITDIVQDEKQYLAVVGGIPANVPVVDAKPTARAGVFTAAVVPGMPDIHIRTETGTPTAASLAKGVTPENADARPVGFTSGGNSHEAIIRFPKESGQEPIYVSVTHPLTPGQLKQRQEEENRLQQAWNNAHPVRAAREVEYLAGVALDSARQAETRLREAVELLKNTPTGLTLSNPELYPYTFTRPHRRIVAGAFEYTLSPSPLVIDTSGSLRRLMEIGPEAVYQKPTEDIEGAFQQWKYLVEDLTTMRTTLLQTEWAIADAEKQVQLQAEVVKQKEQELAAAQNAVTVAIQNNAHPVRAAREVEYLAGVALDSARQAETRLREAVELLKNTPTGLTLGNPELYPYTFTRPHRRIVAGAFEYTLSPSPLVIDTSGSLRRLMEIGPEAVYQKPTEDIEGAFQQWKYLVEDLTTMRTTLLQTEWAIADAEKQVQLQAEVVKQKEQELAAAQNAVTVAIQNNAHPVRAAREVEYLAGVALDSARQAETRLREAVELLKNTPTGLTLGNPELYPYTFTRPHRRIVAGAFEYTLSPSPLVIDTSGSLRRLMEIGPEAVYQKPTEDIEGAFQQWKYLVEDLTTMRTTLLQTERAIADAEKQVQLQAEIVKQKEQELAAAQNAVSVALLSLLTEAGSVGHNPVSILTINPRLLVDSKTKIESGMPVVEMPVRGHLVEKDGQTVLELLTTGGSVPKTVPVLNAERDEATGLDRITVPAVGGAPSLTILINPAPATARPSNTGNQSQIPMTPVHTGTEVIWPEKIVTITTPAGNTTSLQDFIYWRPDASGTGVEPVYVMLSSPYGETNAKGKYSGRDYNTDKAGGPIQNLDWKSASIDRAGVDKVKLHTGRFESTPENAVMLDRLEKILKGELQVTDIDKRYYTHEIRELERYRNFGIKDGEVPENKAEVWNNTHTATLEDYQLSSDETLLYTPEALNSQE